MSSALVGTSSEQAPLDTEWVELMKEARGLGLTVNNVQAFLAASAGIPTTSNKRLVNS